MSFVDNPVIWFGEDLLTDQTLAARIGMIVTPGSLGVLAKGTKIEYSQGIWMLTGDYDLECHGWEARWPD